MHVRMIDCCLPSSPTAWRAALIRVVSADSLTKRSPQIASSSSSLRTTAPRWVHEVCQHVEHLGFDPDLLATSSKDDAVQVQLAVGESDHITRQ